MRQDAPPAVKRVGLDQARWQQELRMPQAPEQGRNQVGNHEQPGHRHAKPTANAVCLLHQLIRGWHRSAEPVAEPDDADCLTDPQDH